MKKLWKKLWNSILKFFNLAEEEQPNTPVDPPPDPGPLPDYPLPVKATATTQWMGPLAWNSGILVCTQDKVAGLLGEKEKDHSASISFVSVRFVQVGTGYEETHSFQSLSDNGAFTGAYTGNAWIAHAMGSDGLSQNWKLVGYQAYTSRGVGDGTRRGYVWIPFIKEGTWDVYVQAHMSVNRGICYICAEKYSQQKGLGIDVYRWDQNWEGNSNREVLLTSNMVFREP